MKSSICFFKDTEKFVENQKILDCFEKRLLEKAEKLICKAFDENNLSEFQDVINSLNKINKNVTLTYPIKKLIKETCKNLWNDIWKRTNFSIKNQKNLIDEDYTSADEAFKACKIVTEEEALITYFQKYTLFLENRRNLLEFISKECLSKTNDSFELEKDEDKREQNILIDECLENLLFELLEICMLIPHDNIISFFKDIENTISNSLHVCERIMNAYETALKLIFTNPIIADREINLKENIFKKVCRSARFIPIELIETFVRCFYFLLKSQNENLLKAFNLNLSLEELISQALNESYKLFENLKEYIVNFENVSCCFLAPIYLGCCDSILHTFFDKWKLIFDVFINKIQNKDEKDIDNKTDIKETNVFPISNSSLSSFNLFTNTHPMTIVGNFSLLSLSVKFFSNINVLQCHLNQFSATIFKKSLNIQNRSSSFNTLLRCFLKVHAIPAIPSESYFLSAQSALKIYEYTKQECSSECFVNEAWKSLSIIRTKAQNIIVFCFVNPVNVALQKYHIQKVWNSKSKNKILQNKEYNNFSPTTYMIAVNEYLLNLLQNFQNNEKICLKDSSSNFLNNKDSDINLKGDSITHDDEKSMDYADNSSLLWQVECFNAVSKFICEKVADISSLSEFGFIQLLVDLEYLCKIGEMLNADVKELNLLILVLKHIITLNKNKTQEDENKAADCDKNHDSLSENPSFLRQLDVFTQKLKLDN